MARRLNIGGEKAHPDWEVFNIHQGEYVDHLGDAKDLSRFDDETFDEIYASHIIEHFDYNGPLQAALKHWYRVLKAGGKLYISVPNMDVLCKLFLMRDKLSEENRFGVMRIMFGGHIDRYDYHYVGFCGDILKSFLAEAGFKKVKEVEDFGIFEDASTLRIGGIPISLNVVVFK